MKLNKLNKAIAILIWGGVTLALVGCSNFGEAGWESGYGKLTKGKSVMWKSLGGVTMALWGFGTGETWGAGTVDIETGHFQGVKTGTLMPVFGQDGGYDISNVRKVTFDVTTNANSADVKVTCNLGGKKEGKDMVAAGNGATTTLSVETTESITDNTYLLLFSTQDDFYLKNIAFWDANGNEVVPKIVGN